MKARRAITWVAVFVMMCFAACNYTVGDCYPVGQGAGDVGAGNGEVASVGAGPSGDGPQGQAQSALSEAQCNAPPDDGACGLAGCTPSRTCLDMYDACQDKPKKNPCRREIDGLSLCGICQDDCIHKRPYKFSDCYGCGFSDP